MADFKKLLYDKVITVLNTNSAGLTFDGGYEFIMHQGIPYVIDQTSLEAYDYQRTEVIPVSEEYNQETPSVNATDRSDYICQYQIMFRIQHVDDVKTALNEFRDYFFADKQFTLDGYTVGIKTVRGNKQASVMVEGGNIYARYKIDVYCTATKYGYIVKDTDIWQMRRADIIVAGNFELLKEYEIVTLGTTDWNAVAQTTGVTYNVGDVLLATNSGNGDGTVKENYKTLKLVEDTVGTQGNPIFSNATGKAKGNNELNTLSSKLRVAYESDEFTKHLYSYIMNKEDEAQTYDLKHTFDGEIFSYEAQLGISSRRLVVGGTVILELDWFEKDA